MSIQNIKTVILVMFENRSFDHMLGHLSFEGLNPAVNGLLPPPNQDQYANPYKGGLYYPFHRPDDTQLQSDLPHEYNFVATQLAKDVNTGLPDMDGFVQAYGDLTGIDPNIQSDPMSFFASDQIPITSFLAQTFSTCDNWFCPLPTSTQPNRTVAFCGHSGIYETKLQDIPADGNIFDWLDGAGNGVTWGVYSDGLPFFSLYLSLWGKMFGPNFHHYEQLATDLKNGTAPQVIIVEPSYQDGPHIPPDHPNDNHPPLAIGWGEDFLRRTYQAATINQDTWKETLMVVYYDEHGGFYDHVAPPAFDNLAAGNAAPPAPYSFDTLGPRVPAILVSPWVQSGSVSHERYDHTSVLQFLAERFTPGAPYSAQVDNRKKQGINSISGLIGDIAYNVPSPVSPQVVLPAPTLLGTNIVTPPTSGMGEALEGAAMEMIRTRQNDVDAKYPLLNNWKQAIEQGRP